ncbi:SulP family inorganic anion transporter [Limimaricola cinnabarinus]|nr:SulP family inorganic anion transporter [Limimaricola cinnabarinus]
MPMTSKTIAARLDPRRPWFAEVDRAALRHDLLAGLTNATVVLPQGIAFAIIAGLPPRYGLYTAIVVTLVAAFWGSSRVMVSGPTTAISAVLFATLGALALPGSAEYVALALTLTLMVGALQLAAGLLGAGAIIAFISHSVIIGFTAAAALLIAATQLAPALGLPAQGGDALQRLTGTFSALPDTAPLALLISIGTLAVLLGLGRLDRRIPAYMIALAGAGLLGWAIDAEARGVAMFAPLGMITPAFRAPDLDPAMVMTMIPGAVAIAFVGLLEAISIGRAFAIRREERYDADQEMVGQGLSNMIGSLFQCYAGSGSFTRSGLNAESGARTPLAAIFAAGFLLVLLVLVAPLVRYIPVPAMAAIILHVAWRLVDLAEIRHIIATSRSETVILLATFGTGVISELTFAIMVGAFASLAAFLYQSARPIVAVGAPVTEPGGRRAFANAHLRGLDQCPQISMTRLEGPLFFASVEHVERELRRIDARDGAKTRILSLKGTGKIDLAGADFILKEARRARRMGLGFLLIAANPEIIDVLRRLGVLDALGARNVHAHKSDAIREAVAQARDTVCARCSLRVYHECAGKPGPPAPRAATARAPASFVQGGTS